MCTRRLSAFNTRTRKPSISVTSLRLGRWPKVLITRPATVSNSSSGKALPKYSLKLSIGVSALTRKSPLGNGRI